MNKKAEFNTQGMLIGALTVGLFFTIIASIIAIMSGVYNTTGYDQETEGGFIQYSGLQKNISSKVQEAYEQVDKVTVDPNLFDYLAGLFNKILAPFKFIYRSFTLILGLSSKAASDLNLLPAFTEYIASILIVLVIIGIVMLKIFMNRKK